MLYYHGKSNLLNGVHRTDTKKCVYCCVDKYTLIVHTFLFPYENHDSLCVCLNILFLVLFRVLLKGLGFPRFLLGIHAPILYFRHKKRLTLR